LTARRREAMRVARSVVILLAAMSVLAQGVAAAALDTIGTVRSSAGTAAVTRGGEDLPATAGTKLLAGDILTTGSDGTMGVILRDNSTLSIGPESRIIIEAFLFSGKAWPAGTHQPGNYGVPFGSHRQAGPRVGPFRDTDGLHRHPGDPFRGQGGRAGHGMRRDA
jgi:hypothetical protein